MSDFVSKVIEFNSIAGTKAEFNTRKLALYIGLILEETWELVREVNYLNLDAGNGLSDFANDLKEYSELFKNGEFDNLVQNVNRKEVLDACADISVVSIGGGICVGADILGAVNEVADNNLSKYPIVDGNRVVLKDANGKVMKPEGYKKPELAQFLL